eukprot:374035-Pelagomonas_calceolata.AAC.13
MWTTPQQLWGAYAHQGTKDSHLCSNTNNTFESRDPAMIDSLGTSKLTIAEEIHSLGAPRLTMAAKIHKPTALSRSAAQSKSAASVTNRLMGVLCTNLWRMSGGAAYDVRMEMELHTRASDTSQM